MNLWFTEDISIVEGARQQIKIKKTLHSEKSEFQQIEFLETEKYGNMMLLDGIIMTTEFDESGYHEMIAHVPLFAHKNPERVLVIGGGDGGTVREVVKHPSVEKVDMCEIDRRVVELSRDYLPSIASALDDPRVELVYKDGVEWIKNHKNTYDVIMVDSTDPVGFAEGLFQKPFLESCRDALREDGILVNQAENMMIHTGLIQNMIQYGKDLFSVQKYYFTVVPTYPHGIIGFTFFSKTHEPWENLKAKLEHPEYRWVDALHYWTPEIQTSSFHLPARIRKSIYGN